MRPGINTLLPVYHSSCGAKYAHGHPRICATYAGAHLKIHTKKVDRIQTAMRTAKLPALGDSFCSGILIEILVSIACALANVNAEDARIGHSVLSRALVCRSVKCTSIPYLCCALTRWSRCQIVYSIVHIDNFKGSFVRLLGPTRVCVLCGFE